MRLADGMGVPNGKFTDPTGVPPRRTRESPGVLSGVLMHYGTKARDRPEMFEMNSLHWDPSGIIIREQHNRQAPILRAVPYLEGRELRINSPLLNTTRGRDISEAMKGPNPLFLAYRLSFRPKKNLAEVG